MDKNINTYVEILRDEIMVRKLNDKEKVFKTEENKLQRYKIVE